MRIAHTIKCPVCLHTQTGIIKISTSRVQLVACEDHNFGAEQSVLIAAGDPYIRCSVLYCQHILVDEELSDAISPVVQFPSDLINQLKKG